MVQQITANFDSFSEDEPWGANQGASGAFGCMASSPPDRQEFIGYTFKRKKDIARTTVAGFFNPE